MKDFSTQSLSVLLQKELAVAHDAKSLEAVKISFLGRKGYVAQLLSSLKDAPLEQKPILGVQINAFKELVCSTIQARADLLLQSSLEADKIAREGFDVTAMLPQKDVLGNLHFYTKFYEEIEDIFISMGFELFEGPEVETDYFNFTALNIGPDHPARDMYDTLWLKGETNQLLRTHTSPVQIRAMKAKGAPLAGVAVGRVFRHEAVDATHEVVFSQCEGILVDKNIGLPALLGVAKTFLERLFAKNNLDIRVRPGFFPFVVPGIEIDMKCVFCKKGCSICKQSGWIEVFPGGLIHPLVLEAVNIDTQKYSGFAFGFGVERLAMLRHQIHDVRLFKSGDARFSASFVNPAMPRAPLPAQDKKCSD